MLGTPEAWLQHDGMQGQETLLPLQHAVMMQGQSLKLLDGLRH